MRAALIQAAIAIASRGIIPSISDIAEAAQVSRATAYRHFPSQSVLVQAMVIEALGPIWRWLPESDDAEERVGRLLAFGFRRMDDYEAPLRAALRLALDQWSRERAGTIGNEPRIVRGNRIRLLRLALAPLARRLPKRSFDRLVQGLAIVFGTETMVVLKDMFGLEGPQVAQVAEWVARSLVRAAIAEENGRAAPARRPAARSRRRR
jgi:AcrR family transcriptional regulator